MMPSISVIIPVYNRFELTKHAVASVLAQTLPVFEIILVDDGSIDGTSELLPRYIEENPAWRERVRYFHQENRGASSARNSGIAQAKGEWLAFHDNDDLWLPQKLEWQFRALERYKDECGLCFTDAWFMNTVDLKTSVFQCYGIEYNEAIGFVDDVDGLVEHLEQVWVPTVVVRADLVRRVGAFDCSMHYNEDQEFLFRMALVTKFCYVSMPMALFDRTPAPQRHLGRSTDAHKEDFRLQQLQSRLEKNLYSCGTLSPHITKTLRTKLRAIHSQWANWYLRNGNYEKARKSISQAAKYDLAPGVALKWVLTQATPGLAKNVVTWRERRDERQESGSYF
jgi:glycosyltransferase involved in cell wall biosynthesis